MTGHREEIRAFRAQAPSRSVGVSPVFPCPAVRFGPWRGSPTRRPPFWLGDFASAFRKFEGFRSNRGDSTHWISSRQARLCDRRNNQEGEPVGDPTEERGRQTARREARRASEASPNSQNRRRRTASQYTRGMPAYHTFRTYRSENIFNSQLT